MFLAIFHTMLLKKKINFINFEHKGSFCVAKPNDFRLYGEPIESLASI